MSYGNTDHLGMPLHVQAHGISTHATKIAASSFLASCVRNLTLSNQYSAISGKVTIARILVWSPDMGRRSSSSSNNTS